MIPRMVVKRHWQLGANTRTTRISIGSCRFVGFRGSYAQVRSYDPRTYTKLHERTRIRVFVQNPTFACPLLVALVIVPHRPGSLFKLRPNGNGPCLLFYGSISAGRSYRLPFGIDSFWISHCSDSQRLRCARRWFRCHRSDECITPGG